MRVAPVLWLLLFLLLLLLLPVDVVGGKKKKKPHVLFILADDLGWHDVDWVPYADMHTPYLDELRKESLELTQFYTQPKCTAARAALMTAKYPYKMGLQTNKVFTKVKNNTLDLSLKLMPYYFKEMGYRTHMVGKWHLGHCNKESTPIYRGFDTHFGSWGNNNNHFTHETSGLFDWNWQNEPYWEANGTYSVDLITNHTVHMLKKHFTNNSTKNESVFVYMAHLVPHAPAMAPEKYITETKCKLIPEKIRYNDTTNITNVRRTFCGMVAAMDEGIGNITKTLRELGVLDDFIIVFTSDNGGATKVSASNYPLRGNKQTIYEGGTRVRTLLRAPQYLKKNQTTGEYNGLLHMVDWLPTFIRAAGKSPKKLLPNDTDGKNMWSFIRRRVPTSRRWMVYNIDSNRQLGAIRFKNGTDDFKFVFSNGSGWEPGYRYQEPRPESEIGSDTLRRGAYPRNGQAYFLYDLIDNEEELPPNVYPDAAESNPQIFRRMKRKLKSLTKLEVAVPTYYRLARFPKNGAHRVGGC